MALITKTECQWAKRANAACWILAVKRYISLNNDPSAYIRLVVRNRFANGVFSTRKAQPPEVIRQLCVNVARSFGVEYHD